MLIRLFSKTSIVHFGLNYQLFQCYIDHLIHHTNLLKNTRSALWLYDYIMGNFGIITTNPMLAV